MAINSISTHSALFCPSLKKWNDKCDLLLDSFSLSKYFVKISMIYDIYLRDVLFRMLHRKFYINNILVKIRKVI